MAEDISKKRFKKEVKKADENISKIFNPNNVFKRRQKEILKNIFNK